MAGKPDFCTLCMQLFNEPEDEDVVRQIMECPINGFMMHVRNCEVCFMVTSQKYARDADKWTKAMDLLSRLAAQSAKQRIPPAEY